MSEMKLSLCCDVLSMMRLVLVWPHSVLTFRYFWHATFPGAINFINNLLWLESSHNKLLIKQLNWVPCSVNEDCTGDEITMIIIAMMMMVMMMVYMIPGRPGHGPFLVARSSFRTRNHFDQYPPSSLNHNPQQAPFAKLQKPQQTLNALPC